MHMKIDIHQYDKKFDGALRHLAKITISERNKTLIRSFSDACLLRQVCGKVRLIRAIGALGTIAEHLGKDFDQADRTDIERVLTILLRRQPAYSTETIATYKRILRRFMTYVAHPDAFPNIPVPPTVSWVNSHLRKRDRVMIRRADLLTPEEIDVLLRTCDNDRDRAFISFLWEGGPRVGEIGNLKLKDVQRVSYGYTVTITGKTGTRSPLLISSAPYLSRWLALHPKRDDPEAPVWLHHLGTKPLGYNAICVMLARLFKRCGINKPSHPHIFRHSRVTYVLANAIMNEQQSKLYFGWSPDSDMPGSTYAHLIDSDVNNAILRENHLSPQQQHHEELRPIACHNCRELNAAKTEYCTKCGAVLDMKRAYEHQQLHDSKEQLFTSMFKLLVEKGLVDDAARSVHDAHLGDTLRRLALHATGERNIRETGSATTVKEEPLA